MRTSSVEKITKKFMKINFSFIIKAISYVFQLFNDCFTSKLKKYRVWLNEKKVLFYITKKYAHQRISIYRMK